MSAAETMRDDPEAPAPGESARARSRPPAIRGPLPDYDPPGARYVTRIVRGRLAELRALRDALDAEISSLEGQAKWPTSTNSRQ